MDVQSIAETSKHKYLGVIINKHIDWKDHVHIVQNITSSTRSTLRVLRSKVSSCFREVKKTCIPGLNWYATNICIHQNIQSRVKKKTNKQTQVFFFVLVITVWNLLPTTCQPTQSNSSRAWPCLLCVDYQAIIFSSPLMDFYLQCLCKSFV